MFAERFDSLMSIAELSNTNLGRAINMNSSHVGRLRSGARALPKKHDFLAPLCLYLAKHLKKDYQLNALQKLTGIPGSVLSSPESIGHFLETWLLEKEPDSTVSTARLISGFSHIANSSLPKPESTAVEEAPLRYMDHLYGNAGKRRAVEQFFLMILKEEKPQTLLLFSDENMAWMYEDEAFARRWAELFTQVLMKGNRVRIIHNVSRNLNELIEAVIKWIPIYMTGMIEPYCYPRLRDGLFQRTMFIAPKTAAIISSSVQQETDGMLNLFLTDQAALDTLTEEYEHLFSLCRPLMKVYSGKDMEQTSKAILNLVSAEGATNYTSVMPPLFAMPESLVHEIVEMTGCEALFTAWKKDVSVFRKNIKSYQYTVNVLDPEIAMLSPQLMSFPMAEALGMMDYSFTPEQYQQYIERLRNLESRYNNLSVHFKGEIAPNMMLLAKDELGVMMAKANRPMVAFFLSDRNMVNAFWDYLSNEK